MKWILEANFSSFVLSGHDYGQVQWLCPNRIILRKWLFGFLTIEDKNHDRLQWLIVWSRLEKVYTCNECHWSSKMGCVVSIRSWLRVRSPWSIRCLYKTVLMVYPAKTLLEPTDLQEELQLKIIFLLRNTIKMTVWQVFHIRRRNQHQQVSGEDGVWACLAQVLLCS